MTPLEFLAVVLPSPGHGFYCAAELSTKKKEHTYVEILEELENPLTRWNGAAHDIYFALSTFEEAGTRLAANARYTKALWVDIDCNHPKDLPDPKTGAVKPKAYPSGKAAVQALSEFLDKTGLAELGQPWLVSSGGGVHAYWPLTEEVPISRWKPVAEKLKHLCRQEGLDIDMTCTSDEARVMRAPGTTNTGIKGGKKQREATRAKQLLEGTLFDLDEIDTRISRQLTAKYTPVPALDLPGDRPNRVPGATQLKLMENSSVAFDAIWKRTEEGTGCAQLSHYVAKAQEDGMEPLWRGILSWVKVCTDADVYAPKVSALHPYDDARMHQKLAEIKGPYPCSKMDSENPGICKGCAHWGKLVNPLALGRQVQTETAEKQVPLKPLPLPGEPEDEYTIPDYITRPEAPRGFSYGRHGGIYCKRQVEDADGTKTQKEVQILPYDLFVVDMLRQEADYTVHMIALRPEGPKDVSMPSRCVVSKDETVKFLAAQNIIASYGQGNDKNLFDYVRACVEEASMAKRAVIVPNQCGWQKDGSFVYNYRVFTPDGREVTVPMPGLENINANTNPVGTMDGWREFWHLMIRRKMHTMLALCLDSFACPLMHFTDYEGFVWHIGSTESGTGKSLALRAKAGVWGHPVHYRTGKGTSPVAMQQRAGLLNSLPLVIDEITSKSRADLEWAPSFIFDISEGQGKERMEAGANKERVNNSRWKLTCTMTSNTHLTDYMSGARKHSSNGELLRMLEWTPNKALEFTDDDRAILKRMKDHYGLAGEAWVRWIVTHQELVKQVIQNTEHGVKTELKFTDDERYWHAGCTIIVAAAILLGKKYAGILDVPVRLIVEALRELVDKARVNIKRNERTAEDVLNAYTRDNYGSFIIVSRREGRLLTAWSNGDTVDKSITRSKVLGRVEIDTMQPGWVEYFLEEQLLKVHCVSMSFGYADFKAQLESMFSVTYIKKSMLSGTNGPPMRVNCIHISRKADDIHDDFLPVGQTEDAG